MHVRVHTPSPRHSKLNTLVNRRTTLKTLTESTFDTLDPLNTQ